jgi:hypothetical protein
MTNNRLSVRLERGIGPLKRIGWAIGPRGSCKKSEMIMNAPLPMANVPWAQPNDLRPAPWGCDPVGATRRIVGHALCALVRWQGKRIERRLAEYRPDDRLL